MINRSAMSASIALTLWVSGSATRSLVAGPGGTCPRTTVESFDDGLNAAGWTIGTGDVLVDAGGHPDGYLRNTFLVTFAPRPRTAPGQESAFTGNYRARQVSALGIDLNTFLDGGLPLPEYPLTVMLGNDAGTPLDPDDDCFVYFTGQDTVPSGLLPCFSGVDCAGWSEYSFDVPSQSRVVPSGWLTIGAEGLCPAGDDAWNEIIEDVDIVQFYYGNPAVPQLFNTWDIGIDNPRITTSACVDCVAVADCADLDSDGIRDDHCLWWSCTGGLCEATAIIFADMGGQFGACPPDGAADGNDRFHALNAFANSDPNGPPGTPYPCEPDAPQAMNVDAGGPFGSCAPDGVADANDAFAALNAFNGSSPCACPLDGGPTPVPLIGAHVERAELVLVPGVTRVEPGDRVEIDVYIEGRVTDLRGYQLHPVASPGLELVDMFVESRNDHVFSGLAFWDAYNLDTGQLAVGLDTAGIPCGTARGYLATLVYRTRDGSESTVDLLHDEHDSAQRTYLFATSRQDRIDITRVEPARIKGQPRPNSAGAGSAGRGLRDLP